MMFCIVRPNAKCFLRRRFVRWFQLVSVPWWLVDLRTVSAYNLSESHVQRPLHSYAPVSNSSHLLCRWLTHSLLNHHFDWHRSISRHTNESNLLQCNRHCNWKFPNRPVSLESRLHLLNETQKHSRRENDLMKTLKETSSLLLKLLLTWINIQQLKIILNAVGFVAVGRRAIIPFSSNANHIVEIILKRERKRQQTNNRNEFIEPCACCVCVVRAVYACMRWHFHGSRGNGIFLTQSCFQCYRNEFLTSIDYYLFLWLLFCALLNWGKIVDFWKLCSENKCK